MPEPNLSGTGYLVIRAVTASGAIPLENAKVTIRGNTPEQNGVLFTLTTNRDGLTPKVSLPAPPASVSGAPGGGVPYSTYNIDVSLDGYYSNNYQNVPVFDRVTALQSAELIPLSRNGYENNFTPNDTRFYESENPAL